MRTWNFTAGGSTHTVQIAHDPIFSGELEIYLDGKEEVRDIIPSGESYEYRFVVVGRLCLVRILYSSMRSGDMASLSSVYEVIVDGTPMKYKGIQDLVPPPSDSIEVDIIPPDIEAEVRRLKAQNKLVDAVKLVRLYVNLNLTEAYNYVKQLV